MSLDKESLEYIEKEHLEIFRLIENLAKEEGFKKLTFLPRFYLKNTDAFERYGTFGSDGENLFVFGKHPIETLAKAYKIDPKYVLRYISYTVRHEKMHGKPDISKKFSLFSNAKFRQHAESQANLGAISNSDNP